MGRRIILFDLDGTLVDTACHIARALSLQRRARGGDPVDAGLVRPLVSRGADLLVRTVLAEYASDPVADLLEFRQILGALDPDPAALFPGVAMALEMLSAMGWRMAVVTNKPEGLSRSLLSAHGLAGRFETVVGFDTTAHGKPHPAPVRYALSSMRAASREAVFVGDSEVDAEAARRAALPFVLFEGGYGAAQVREADIAFLFNAFDALPALLASFVDNDQRVRIGRPRRSSRTHARPHGRHGRRNCFP